MSGIMVILDGMQDLKYEILNGFTPYDYGKGDNIKALESAARTGALRSTPEGFVPDTMACVVNLLGVPTESIPQGRSYIEALVQGIEVGDKDIILRCNFVKLDDNGNLDIPCCSAPEDIARALRSEIAALEGNSITPVGSYKSLQLIREAGEYLDGLISFAPHQNQGAVFENILPRGNPLADKLADFSREMYKKYKPYTVLNWAPAVKMPMPSFDSLHDGMTGAMVSKTDAPMGAAIAMGMECPIIPTATGDTDTDLAAKLDATLKLLQQNDFVMLHIGGPDEATHRQDAKEKADFIRRADVELIGPMMKAVPEGTRVMLTCDHEAYCSTAGHTDEPVRFWIWEKGASLSGETGVKDGREAIRLLMK